ncbi:MAG: hypothetical protein K2Z25_08885 [Beijerinckiaceae bacterium]|nr:hypothetical protein [Beijerinckiaceae bacterium]
MNQRPDDVGSVIRKELAARRQALRERVAARDPSPDAFRLAVGRRREAYAALMQRVGTEAVTTAELDRMVRFGDRFHMLIDRTRRR